MLGPDRQSGGIYGSDLGITVSLPNSDRQAILFGDTWGEQQDACIYPVLRNDDLQATLPLERPASLAPGAPPSSADACDTLTYAQDTAEPPGFRRIRLFPDAGPRDEARVLDTSILRTPAAAFSDGERLYAVFARQELAPCLDNAGCPAGMACTADLGYSGRPIGGCQPHIGTAPDSAPTLCLIDQGCVPPALCAPLPAGVCVATEPYARAPGGAARWYADDPRRGVAQQMYIASAAWPDRPEDYATGFRFTTNKFVFMSARTVAHFDFARPETNDYRPGSHTLLIWGRPHVIGERGFQSLLFLLAQPLAGLIEPDGRINWAPKFFAGYGSDGRVVWSDNEADAQPLYGGVDPEQAPEFDYVVQSSVTYVEPLQRWVMIYGGSVPAWLASDRATAMVLEPTHPQPTPGALYVRSATHPWGQLTADAPAQQAWSPPRVLLDRVGFKHRIACDEDALDAPDCTIDPAGARPAALTSVLAGLTTPPTPEQAASLAAMCLTGSITLENQYSLADDARGHLYGVNVIESWTQDVSRLVPGLEPGERAAELYWNVSTWNPYQVVLVKSQLRGGVDGVRP